MSLVFTTDYHCNTSSLPYSLLVIAYVNFLRSPLILNHLIFIYQNLFFFLALVHYDTDRLYDT
jgi:hypothetical protein